MKNTVITFILMLAVMGLKAQTKPVGIWNTGSDNTRVEIKELDGNLAGHILSSDNTSVEIGKQLLKDLQLAENGWKGKLYAPRRDEWYDATLEMKEDVLEITIGPGFLSKTVEWKRE